MQVIFTRTHARGYSVTIAGPGIDTATMNPAPGFDARLPHDVAHFIVERELGIQGGLYGQLAAGGTAGTFHAKDAKKPRRAKRRGAAIAAANEGDAAFSEHAVYAAQSRWERREIVPDTSIAKVDLDRIITSFEDFATRWSALAVGESITLEWAA